MQILTTKIAPMKIRCVIIGEDTNNSSQLEKLLEKAAPSIDVLANAGSIKTCPGLIEQFKPDLVFFDYMTNPGEIALFLLKHPQRDFLAVIISLDNDRNPAPTNSDVVFIQKDMLKEEIPILLKKFIENPPLTIRQKKEKETENGQKRLIISSKDNFAIVNVNDIICMEADGKYTTFYLRNNIKEVSSQNIGEYEKLLDKRTFFRTHKSWVVNLECVTRFYKGTGEIILKGNITAHSSFGKKEELLERLVNL